MNVKEENIAQALHRLIGFCLLYYYYYVLLLLVLGVIRYYY